jgi:cap1 methyltransferase
VADEDRSIKRLDSTTSYTSEDEPSSINQSHSFMSQQSHESVISYYNPASDDEPTTTTSYLPNDSVKRSYSHTSDEPDEAVSQKRQKFTSEAEPPPAVEETNGSGTNNSYDAIYSGPSLRMMEKMGYRKDTGLGRLGQGRVEPIEASQQRGRRGLGLRLDELDRVAVKWDPAIEELYIPERVEWLMNEEADDTLLDLTMDTLSSWIRRGPKKLTIDNETKFCDENILKRILESKSVFDNLGAEEMRRARTKSNPFETIRGNIFLNRAAVKMANMDSMFDFMFTNPVDEAGKSLVGENDLLYFADVCAGPGGFTEYVLNRKKWEAKGFGFTLKGENDFKLHDFFAGGPETFSPFYGINDDGNVYDPENIRSLDELVKDETDSGVHFMMADGGFSVEGQENIQEILSKQLYLAQCLVALTVVRTKGHFVVKLFDLFTPFSASLIYLMYKSFQQICICKPNTSRPANSERYLVCKWKKPYTDTIQRYLFDINREMWKNRDQEQDILEFVPMNVMQGDREFFDYIYNSNNTIGKNQIVGLLKIAAYCNDSELVETKQSEIRKQCLQLWKLPDENRKKPIMKTNEQYCAQLLEQKWLKEKFMSAPERQLESLDHVKAFVHSVLDWYFVGVDDINKSSKNRTFFMSRGRFDVHMFNMNSNQWEPISDRTLEMSGDTLIYGEIVKELIGEQRSQIASQSLHIIDGIILGGKDIRAMPLLERNQMCEKFARSLRKPALCSNNKSMPIRCKKLFKLTDIKQFFERLVVRKLKDGSEKMGYDIGRTNDDHDSHTNRFHIPRGLLMLDEVRSDKMRCFSNSQKKIYYFDKNTKKTDFPENLQASDKYASFKNTFTNRLIWKFEIRDQILEKVDSSSKSKEYLYREDLTNWIVEKTPRLY